MRITITQFQPGHTQNIGHYRVLKRRFGFDWVRYRGLAKNHNRLCACFALVNLYNHRKRLLVQRA